MINIKDCWMKNNCKDPCDSKLCIKLYKLNYIYEEAGVSLNMRQDIALRIDKDNSDLKAFQKLKNIQNNIVDFVNDGRQLYIHSKQAGNGKTSWAIKLLNEYINNIWENSPLICRALFINVPYFLLALKDNISTRSEYIQHIKDNILKCDLVIWDDIGTKSATPYEAENLLSMIEGRINGGKSNIFTSNLNDEELHLALGDRLYSRICNLDYNIEFVGGDKRFLSNSNKETK